MNRTSMLNAALVLCFGCLALSGHWAGAEAEQEGKPEYAAVTAGDPQVPVEELQILLTPLTQDELVVEADAWMALVKAAAHEVAGAELAAKSKAEESDEATAPVDGGSEAKAELLERINALHEERIALVDRAKTVLDELDRKGGDTETHRSYLAAVSGIRVDVSDTQAAWSTIVGWAKSEEGGLRWGRNLGKFVAIVVAFWVVSLFAGKAADRILGASKNVSALMQDFASKSIRRVVLAVGVVVGLSALEINIGPLLAMIGAAGFVVAFALQDTLGNLASGIMILVYRPFDVGDLVDVAGVLGNVSSLNLVSVTVHTLDNKVVIVPNNQVWGSVITNATGSHQRRVDMVFGIGYEDDVQKAQGILEKIVADHPLVLDDPEPVVRVHELADSSVNFVCRPWAKTEDYWSVYWDVTRAVKEQFDAQGVGIPFPQRTVHLAYTSDAPSPAGEKATETQSRASAQSEDFPESGNE